MMVPGNIRTGFDAGRRLVTRFLYVVRHGNADPHDGPLSQLGERQAQLTGRRLKDVPFRGIYHGPLPRAAQTAAVIAASLPGVPLNACDLAGDYLPFAPDPGDLPPALASFIAGFSAAERTEGRKLAAAALERFARADGEQGAGEQGAGEQQDTYELLVTHNFLIGWLVSQAMGAPPWRWLGLNQMNCALTIIAYLPGLPASLISFNDAGHLPPELRWTGFPAPLRPASG
jgi:serine/threonine-protein phosphatase PGAM5